MAPDDLIPVRFDLHRWQVERIDKIVARTNAMLQLAGSDERASRASVIRTLLATLLGPA